MEQSENKSFLLELQNMEYRLDEMQDKLDQVDQKLTQVVEALLGNSLTKTGGIINELDEIRKRMVNLEKQQVKNDDFRKKASWTFGVILGRVVQLVVLLYIKTLHGWLRIVQSIQHHKLSYVIM